MSSAHLTLPVCERGGRAWPTKVFGSENKCLVYRRLCVVDSWGCFSTCSCVDVQCRGRSRETSRHVGRLHLLARVFCFPLFRLFAVKVSVDVMSFTQPFPCPAAGGRLEQPSQKKGTPRGRCRCFVCPAVSLARATVSASKPHGFISGEIRRHRSSACERNTLARNKGRPYVQ